MPSKPPQPLPTSAPVAPPMTTPTPTPFQPSINSVQKPFQPMGNGNVGQTFNPQMQQNGHLYSMMPGQQMIQPNGHPIPHHSMPVNQYQH